MQKVNYNKVFLKVSIFIMIILVFALMQYINERNATKVDSKEIEVITLK